FPAEASNAVLALAFRNQHFDRLAADLSVRCLALFLADLDQRFVGNRLHISIAERVGSDARRAYGFLPRYALLNLGANGAVIHQVPILDDLRSVIDRDLRILEPAVRVEMSHAQLGNLAGGSGDRRLVTLAARLRIVEWPEPIGGDLLDLLEELLVSRASVRIG